MLVCHTQLRGEYCDGESTSSPSLQPEGMAPVAEGMAPVATVCLVGYLTFLRDILWLSASPSLCYNACDAVSQHHGIAGVE